MKLKKWCLMLLFVFSYCHAEDAPWILSWNDAIKAFAQKEYTIAHDKYSEAIRYLASIDDQTHPELYVDRGIVLQLLEKYDQALQDFTMAIESDVIITKDKIRAVMHRMAVYASLKLNDQVLADFALWRTISADFPSLTSTADSIIIRNLPDSLVLRKGVQYLFLKLGICANSSDIVFYNSHTCIITKRCPCCVTKAPTLNPEEIIFTALNSSLPCGIASAVALSISPVLVVHPPAMIIYGALVGILQDICLWCASGEGIYANCIEPIQTDIIEPFLYYADLLALDIGHEVIYEFNKIKAALAQYRANHPSRPIILQPCAPCTPTTTPTAQPATPPTTPAPQVLPATTPETP